MRPDDPRIERAAVIVHRRLARDHFICFVFHIWARSWGHALVHFAMWIYDREAVKRHAKRLR